MMLALMSDEDYLRANGRAVSDRIKCTIAAFDAAAEDCCGQSSVILAENQIIDN